MSSSRAGQRAAILIHTSSTATQEQQERLATEYCASHGIEPHTLVFHPTDAFKLLRDGLVDTIVVAYLPADRVDLAEEVTAAGGVLREARQRRRVPQDLGRMFARLFDRGMTVAEIAAIADSPTGEVRAELWRRGRRETGS